MTKRKNNNRLLPPLLLLLLPRPSTTTSYYYQVLLTAYFVGKHVSRLADISRFVSAKRFLQNFVISSLVPLQFTANC